MLTRRNKLRTLASETMEIIMEYNVPKSICKLNECSYYHMKYHVPKSIRKLNECSYYHLSSEISFCKKANEQNTNYNFSSYVHIKWLCNYNGELKSNMT